MKKIIFFSAIALLFEQRPEPGRKLEIIFTDNRMLITDNMEIVDDKPVITDKKKVLQDGSYTITKEQDKLYVTITSKEGTENQQFLSDKIELEFNKTGDTLFSFLYGNSRNVYKKVN